MKKGLPVYGISHGLSQKHRLKLVLTTVFCLLWSEIVQIDAHPLSDSLYVNVPGNKVLGVKADPNETSAAELKVKLAKEMSVRNLETFDMDEYVLIYFEMVLQNERKKLSYYHVPKGATLYLVKDVFNY